MDNDDLMHALQVKENGELVLRIEEDRISYKVFPIEILDAILKACIPAHRDMLLDVRNYLFKSKE